MISVYVASRTRHQQMWRDVRSVWAELGVQVAASWLDVGTEVGSAEYSSLWSRAVTEAAAADMVVLYAEAGDFPGVKGALVEVGAALAAGKPVYVCVDRLGWDRPYLTETVGSWIHHPLVTLAADPDDALADFQVFHWDAAERST